jgi:hypothetical protein
MFKNIFAENSAKKLAFLTHNKAKICKFWIITLFFEKNANFFAKNCQKSQKIVIITSTPGANIQPMRNLQLQRRRCCRLERFSKKAKRTRLCTRGVVNFYSTGVVTPGLRSQSYDRELQLRR